MWSSELAMIGGNRQFRSELMGGVLPQVWTLVHVLYITLVLASPGEVRYPLCGRAYRVLVCHVISGFQAVRCATLFVSFELRIEGTVPLDR